MRLYLYGILRRELQGPDWTLNTLINVPILDYCGPKQIDELVIVCATGKYAYVAGMLWGQALPNGPTGVNMQRVMIEDPRVPKEVRLSEFLLSS